MNLSAIKSLVEKYSFEELQRAEKDLLEERLSIDVKGDDEGEKLTHIIGAIWVIKQMNETGQELRIVLRKYASKIRNSIN